MDEMIHSLILKSQSLSAAINISKMDYFNGEHIRRLSIQIYQMLVPFYAKARV
jgi:hypothetical protein